MTAATDPRQPVEGWRELLAEGAGATGWVDGDSLWLFSHNGGRGSAPLIAAIMGDDLTELAAHYDGTELIIDGERPDRFVVRVEGLDSRTVLMSVVSAAGQPVRVSYRGRDASFVAKVGGQRESWPAAALGVAEEDIGNALNNRWYQPLGPGFGAPGHWLLEEGSLDQFIVSTRDRRAAKRQREAEQRRRNTRERLRDSHFVNPYTFVPLPDTGPARTSPPGHDRCTDDRPLVRLEVTWRAETPLATRTPYHHGDGRTGLIGSAAKGAVRSMHEALTGSCLRVVDLDAAPVHREQMNAGQGDNWEKPESWRTLARVVSIAGPDSSGEWTLTLEIARRTVWVPSTALRLPLTSGEPYDPSHIRGSVAHDKGLRRYQLTVDDDADPAIPPKPDVEWIPLVSHAGARPDGSGYHVPLGEFRRSETDGRRAKVRSGTPVWQEYRRAASDSLDEVTRRRNDPIDLTVEWDGEPIGTRQAVISDLDGPNKVTPGYLFWVFVRDGEVTQLTTAYVWRRVSRNAVRDRIPKDFQPCTDPAALCPTCQVFGGGGATSERNARDRKLDREADDGHGYRGHVRVGPLLTDAAPNRVLCAPLNAPRIGAGQFYLEPPAGSKRADKGTTPLREWDSDADTKRRRPLRGRKFYWPADPEAQRETRGFTHPRWRAEQTPYGQSHRGQEADVWDAGTELHQTITVVGLDRVRLGGLLAAIRPDLLAGPTGDYWSRAVVRMGYGKPLGLGILRASRVAVTLHTPTDRYGPSPTPARVVSEEEWVSWVAMFVESADQSVRDTWPDLRAATDPEHVWPEYVTYPVDEWKHYPHEARRTPSTTYGFTFWKNSAGGERTDLVALPAARDPNQLLPLDPGKEER